MKKGRLRVAAAQVAVSGDIEANTGRVLAGIERAAGGGARAVVFPECALSGYPTMHWPEGQTPFTERRRLNEARNATINAARQHKIFTVVGTVRVHAGHAYNAAYAIAPNGSIAAIYDKIQFVHAPGGDVDQFTAGSRMPIFSIGKARCAMQICMDLRYPEGYRYLKARGAQVVFQLFFAVGKGTTWKLPILEGTLRCRSAENGMFFVAANAAEAGTSVVSRICDNNGVSLAAAASGEEEVVFADLDLDQPHAHFYEARRADILNVVASPPLAKAAKRGKP